MATERLGLNFQVIDNASGTLRKIGGEYRKLLTPMKQVQHSMNNALNGKALNSGQKEVSQMNKHLQQSSYWMKQMQYVTGKNNKEVRGLASNLKKVEQNTKRNTQAQKTYNTSIKNSNKYVNNLWYGLRRIFSIYTAIQGVKAFVQTGDQMTNAVGRLRNADDGLKSIQGHMESIYNTSQKTGTSFLENVNAVAKLRSQTDGVFNTIEDANKFNDLLNKAFVVDGIDSAGQRAVRTQLLQGLASGELRGDEWRTIRENSPTVVEAIARYLGTSKGGATDVAYAGDLDAKTTVDAVYAYADEINARYEEMGMTFQRNLSRWKDDLIRTLTPAFAMWNQLLNSPAIQAFAQGIVNALKVAIRAFTLLLFIIDKVANAIYENWDRIKPILVMLGSIVLGFIALRAFGTLFGAIKTVGTAIAGFGQFAMNVFRSLFAVLTGTATSILGIGTALNVVKLVFLGVFAIIIIGFGILMKRNVEAGYSIVDSAIRSASSIVAVVAGAIAMAINLLKRIGNFFAGLFAWLDAVANVTAMGARNLVIETVEKIINKAIDMYNGFKEALHGIKKAFIDTFNNISKTVNTILNNIIEGIENLVNRAVEGLNTLITGANKIPMVNMRTIDSVSLNRTDPVILGYGDAPEMTDHVDFSGQKVEVTETPAEAFKRGNNTFQYTDRHGVQEEWYNKAYDALNGVKDKVLETRDSIRDEIDESTEEWLNQVANQQTPTDEMLDAVNGANDALGGGGAGSGSPGSIKDNTEEIKETQEKALEELGYAGKSLETLKSMAEQQHLMNLKFDNFNVTVDNSFGDAYTDFDLDGFINGIETGVEEAVKTGVGGLTNDIGGVVNG